MKMDFTKNKFAHRTLSVSAFLFKKRGRVFCSVMFVLLCSAAFLGFHFRNQSITSLAIATLYQTVRADNPLEKPFLNKEKLAIKKVRASADQPVHFEFYSSLPNMKVEVAELPATLSEKNVLPNTPKKVQLAEGKLLKNKIFNSAELEKEFSRHLAQKNYIIQLGIFNHLTAAQKCSETFTQTGLKVNIAKINTKKQSHYRVQLGPFPSLQESQLTQQTLKQKRIPFLLRTIEQG